jgi:UDP:flavonoid glycosyltransferase YjiC (YdhE family)
VAHALIIAKGSLGDIIPMYALAQALQQRGHRVNLATQTQHLRAARSLGLTAAPIDQPTGNQLQRPPRARRWISNDAFGGTETTLGTELAVLRPLAASAEVIIGNQLALTGPLIAAQHHRPWVYCAVSPLSLVSPDNPCLFPLLHGLQRASGRHPAAEAFSQGLVRAYSRLPSCAIRRAQRRLGLGHLGHPRFEGLYSRTLNLLLTSPLLVDRPPRCPPNTVITGFTWLEPGFLGQPRQRQRALDFIHNGSPPILYALGGNARAHPGNFFHESLGASRALGRRSLMVVASQHHATLPSAEDVHVTTYLPYSELFPHLAAVVHSGGIGTLGWALRCALPSLLVPSADDQFDNADRAQSHGYARVLRRRHYDAERVARSLQALLGDDPLRARLQPVARLLDAEQGAVIACNQLEQLIQTSED